jgi:hypothetical protein
MIYFCSEFWMHTGRGIITGVGYPESVEVYHVVGNKRVRLRRIIEWEKEKQRTYPRLCFKVTLSLNILKCYGWAKAEDSSCLIPYKCSNIR